MEIHIAERTSGLARLKPGACYLTEGPDGPILALVVAREGRREALLLNQRDAGGYLPILSGSATDLSVLELQGAVLAPSGAVGDLAGRTTACRAALHLGAGRAYLYGRDGAGRLATFDVVSGVASAIDPAELPQARIWRVLVPESGGVVTVYESPEAD